jgi:hypothetical protein
MCTLPRQILIGKHVKNSTTYTNHYRRNMAESIIQLERRVASNVSVGKLRTCVVICGCLQQGPIATCCPNGILARLADRSPRRQSLKPLRKVARYFAALVSIAARVPGTANAAASPCRARPANSSVCAPAVAMMQDAAPNSANPTIEASRAKPIRCLAAKPNTRR